jgi:hypothetical protein
LHDAQVAWILDQLLGDNLAAVVAAEVDEALSVTAETPLTDLIDADEVKRVARALVAGVPGSIAADALVEKIAGIMHRGPDKPFAAGDLLEREHVEALVDQVLQGTRLAEGVLDDLVRSPLMATVASRFVGRLVGEVLAANKAAASYGCDRRTRIRVLVPAQFRGKSFHDSFRVGRRCVWARHPEDPCTPNRPRFLESWWTLHAEQCRKRVAKHADDQINPAFRKVAGQPVATVLHFRRQNVALSACRAFDDVSKSNPSRKGTRLEKPAILRGSEKVCRSQPTKLPLPDVPLVVVPNLDARWRWIEPNDNCSRLLRPDVCKRKHGSAHPVDTCLVTNQRIRVAHPTSTVTADKRSS